MMRSDAPVAKRLAGVVVPIKPVSSPRTRSPGETALASAPLPDRKEKMR